MSKFSSKCDLYDSMMTVCACELPKNEYEDDLTYELRCLAFFKDKLNGYLHQAFKLKLTNLNIDNEIKLRNNPWILSKVAHSEVKSDKRTKTGEKEKVYYTYCYQGEEYQNLSDIQYYAIKNIRLEDPLDLVLYYGFVPGVVTSQKNGKIYMQIANQAEIEKREESYRQNGFSIEHISHIKREWIDHYNDLLLKRAQKSE